MGLPINIDALIRGNIIESERMEFKEGWNPQPVIETICAFANDISNWGGGYVILGIREQKGVAVLPPVGLPEDEIDSIQQQIFQHCNHIHPNYQPLIVPAVYQDKHIIIIRASGGDNRPYKAPKNVFNLKEGKAYFVRHGSVTAEARDEDERKLYDLANKVPFDDRVNHNAELRDLQLPLMLSFLQEVESEMFETAYSIPFIELCRHMDIARGPVEEMKPLNVGLLLFNDKPERFFRGAYIVIVEYFEEVGNRFREKKFSGPIHVQLRAALDYIRNNVIREEVVKLSTQAESLRKINYPFAAIEEALANAVYHRSYENRAPTEVNIRYDCIEILSFPGPLSPVDNEQLKKDRIVARDYRNRRIGDFLKELNLTEGRGTGIPTIHKAMENNGSPPATLETDEERTNFLVTLPIHPYFKRTVTKSDSNILTQKTIDILEFCREARSRKEILEHIKANKHIIAQLLAPLLEAQYISMTIPNKINSGNQKYITTPKGIKALTSRGSTISLF